MINEINQIRVENDENNDQSYRQIKELNNEWTIYLNKWTRKIKKAQKELYHYKNELIKYNKYLIKQY